MRRINEMLAVVILSLLAVLLAAVGLRAYDTYMVNRQIDTEVKRQEEILSRNREAHERVLEMRREIEELSLDREKLGQFLEEIQAGAAEAVPALALQGIEDGGISGGMTGNALRTEHENLSENTVQPEEGAALDGMAISGNDSLPEKEGIFGDAAISGNADEYGDESVSENVSVSGDESVSENTSVSGNDTVSGNTSVSGNDTVSENTSVSGNATVSENASVSGNDTVSGNTSMSGNDMASKNTGISDNATVFGDRMSLLPGMVSPEITLEQRRKQRSSQEETILANQEDLIRLAERQTDFSDLKIACLGDSITAAANLEGDPDYHSCAYPAVLKELLGAEEVYNLGIGGSSIGRYWSDAFVDRYTQIPPDADIIIVMGGTNDGFCLSQEEFGTLAERKPWTFCGDLDELMRGLKHDYPDARIFFVTPLPNILQDYLMRERGYLLPQKNLSDAILTLSAEYGFEVIDLYNSNILDSHDADIVTDYMPDGVHCNREGYRILAEHIAAEVVRSYE